VLGERAAKLAWRVLFFLCGLGFITVFMPVPPLEPLVQREEWILQGGVFENSKAEPGNVEASILSNWRTRYFRTWSPETGSSANAEIRTIAFQAPRILVVPLVGYPIENDIRVELLCESNSNRKPVATGNMHEVWAQKIMLLPRDWCPGKVVLAASSKSARHYVGVGTPYAGNIWLLLKNSLPSWLFLHLTVFLLLVIPVLAIVPLVQRTGFSAPFAGAIACVGLLAFAEFFLTYWSRSLGAAAALALYVWASYSVMRRAPTLSAQYRAAINPGIKLVYLFSLSMFLLLQAVDTGTGPWQPAYRFFPAVWSSDHLLPRIVAEGLYDLRPVPEIIGGSWHVSDRPPLMSGLQLLAQPLLEVFRSIPSSSSIYHHLPKLIGIVSSCGIVIPLAFLFFKLSAPLKVDAKWRLWALMLVLYSPLLIFNTIYTWPKLITVFFALTGIFVLCLERGSALANAVCAGILFAMALLSHAGVAFGLLALPLFVRALSGRWSLIKIAVSGVVAVLCWIPWSLWQRLVDPPGNALAKFALGGTFGFGEQAKSLGDTVRDAYRGINLEQWLAMKKTALQNLLGVNYTDTNINQYATDWAGRLRLEDFLFVGSSLRFLGVALLCGMVLIVLTKYRNQLRAPYLLLSAGVVGVGLNLLIVWSTHINHHQSYLATMTLLISGALFSLALPKTLRAVLMSLQAIYVAWVWCVDPMLWHRDVDLAVVAVFISTVFLLVVEGGKFFSLAKAKDSTGGYLGFGPGNKENIR